MKKPLLLLIFIIVSLHGYTQKNVGTNNNDTLATFNDEKLIALFYKNNAAREIH